MRQITLVSFVTAYSVLINISAQHDHDGEDDDDDEGVHADVVGDPDPPFITIATCSTLHTN